MCLLIPYYLHSMWQLHIFCFSTRNWNLCEGKGKISYTNFSCLMICLDTWVFSPIVHVDRNEPLTISICFPAFRNSFPSLPSPDWVGELWIRAPNLPFLLQLNFQNQKHSDKHWSWLALFWTEPKWENMKNDLLTANKEINKETILNWYNVISKSPL